MTSVKSSSAKFANKCLDFSEINYITLFDFPRIVQNLHVQYKYIFDAIKGDSILEFCFSMKINY